MKRTRLCELLNIDYPIIQAPMDWITDASMAAAVSNAGGLGVLGPNAGARTVTTDVTETGERLREQIRLAKSLTSRPFGVNLIAMRSDEFPEGGKAYSDRCFQVVLEEEVPVVVFVGNDPAPYTPALKQAGIKVLHRALPASVAAAREAEDAGVDAFVAVGCEAGGHSGDERIPTSVLVPLIADTLAIPIVAGGGIGDGRGIVAALAWGAEGAYLGTRFIATTECTAHQNVKEAVVRAGEAGTAVLPGTLGILRALKTPLISRCLDMEAAGCSLPEITEAYHSGYMKGMLEGDLEAGAFVCGAACAFVHRIESAGEVVRRLVEEADEALVRLQAS